MSSQPRRMIFGDRRNIMYNRETPCGHRFVDTFTEESRWQPKTAERVSPHVTGPRAIMSSQNQLLFKWHSGTRKELEVKFLAALLTTRRVKGYNSKRSRNIDNYNPETKRSAQWVFLFEELPTKSKTRSKRRKKDGGLFLQNDRSLCNNCSRT
ncbi:hypothetical protein EVAR_81924_1 [Eumeta japonica]|uniref:Uncharacterized protein n=1 Tax=Eumeta variegata TaxID=151549 RepID=A0A4C1UYZ7_EUMVA|nr:hypothetical protein EVAR_81924_1 [Eumeta japonica]